MSNKEQTLSIIKPDAVERNLTEEIKNIFSKNNLKLLKMLKKFKSQKMKQPNFIKFMNQSLFMKNYVVICHPVPSKLLFWREKMLSLKNRELMGQQTIQKMLQREL